MPGEGLFSGLRSRNRDAGRVNRESGIETTTTNTTNTTTTTIITTTTISTISTASTNSTRNQELGTRSPEPELRLAPGFEDRFQLIRQSGKEVYPGERFNGVRGNGKNSKGFAAFGVG